jgi:acyl-CoA thioesterase
MPFDSLLDALRPAGNGWEISVPRDWRQGRTLFGGLQAALSIRVMRRALGVPLPLRALQASFVGPSASDPLSLTTRVLRRGKNVTFVECELLDGDRVACKTLGVFGAPRTSIARIPPPQVAVPVDPESLADLPFIPGVTPNFTQFLALRWASGAPPFSGGADTRTRVFARFRDPVTDPEAELIALSDALPSPVISMMSEPTPSSSLTWLFELLSEPKAAAPGSWWFLDNEVIAGHDGYASQSTLLYDASGQAVAVSRQSVAVFG